MYGFQQGLCVIDTKIFSMSVSTKCLAGAVMTVRFEYPVVYLVGDDYGDSYVVWKHARARLLNLTDKQ